ncbi:MAG: BrnA antitoxin family protein [Methylococcales bacterium]
MPNNVGIPWACSVSKQSWLPIRKPIMKFTSFRCARRKNMKLDPSSLCSDEAAEFTPRRMRQARLRIGLKDVSREEWQAAVREQANRKVHVDVELDSDILAWLKAKAGEQDYQTLINATLRKAMAGEN